MASRKRSRARRRTTGDALRRLLSPGGSALATRTTLVRQLSGRLLTASRSRSRASGPNRRRSTKRRRSPSRLRSGSLFRSLESSPISAVTLYSSGLDALLPTGFRKFLFLGATPTRSTTSGSSLYGLYSGTQSSLGNWNTPVWTPAPGPTYSGPRIPSTPTRETSV